MFRGQIRFRPRSLISTSYSCYVFSELAFRLRFRSAYNVGPLKSDRTNFFRCLRNNILPLCVWPVACTESGAVRAMQRPVKPRAIWRGHRAAERLRFNGRMGAVSTPWWCVVQWANILVWVTTDTVDTVLTATATTTTTKTTTSLIQVPEFWEKKKHFSYFFFYYHTHLSFIYSILFRIVSRVLHGLGDRRVRLWTVFACVSRTTEWHDRWEELHM
jgi:hypothetical protein